MNTMRKQSGFTLIELMIVVAILAILMAIAIPAYQDYTIRAQVSEGMNLSGGVRTAVAEYWTDRGTWPTSNSEAGVSPEDEITGEYVSGVAVGDNGVITATFSNTGDQNANAAINSTELVLTPTSEGGSVAWNCEGNSGMETKYLPARCRD